MYQEAIAEFGKALALSGSEPEITAELGLTYAVAGRHDEARKALDELNELAERRYGSP